jgi:hypothetical protein
MSNHLQSQLSGRGIRRTTEEAKKKLNYSVSGGCSRTLLGQRKSKRLDGL